MPCYKFLWYLGFCCMLWQQYILLGICTLRLLGGLGFV